MKWKPVKTAVIGCGMISDIYLSNLKNTFSIIDLVGCSDLCEEKAQEKAERYGIEKMTNEEILRRPEIELVLNLTYPTAHFEISRQILEAGKHCYSEKMMCLTMAEADELNVLRKRNECMFAVAPDTFLGAGMQSARFYVDHGLIGEPVQATANLSRGYHMVKEDRDDAVRKYSVMHEGGGIPYDMGGYYLHALFHILGPVKSICGYAKTRNSVRPFLNPRHHLFQEPFQVNTPNTICCSMEFENGVFGSMNLSSEYDTQRNEFQIWGTNGILSLGDPNLFGDRIVLRKGKTETELPLNHPYAENSRGIGAADLAWALRTGREPRLSFEMGYHALEVIQAVETSTKDGQRKELAGQFERPVPIPQEFYQGTAQEASLFV